MLDSPPSFQYFFRYLQLRDEHWLSIEVSDRLESLWCTALRSSLLASRTGRMSLDIVEKHIHSGFLETHRQDRDKAKINHLRFKARDSRMQSTASKFDRLRVYLSRFLESCGGLPRTALGLALESIVVAQRFHWFRRQPALPAPTVTPKPINGPRPLGSPL